LLLGRAAPGFARPLAVLPTLASLALAATVTGAPDRGTAARRGPCGTRPPARECGRLSWRPVRRAG
ncbi:hypothetical protein ACWD0D_34550, partial [Streptomyces griseoincarnatus]